MFVTSGILALTCMYQLRKASCKHVFSSPCSFGHLDFTGSDFHRAIAERANRSIHQLKCALREGDVTVGEDMLDPSFNTSVGNEDAENAWRELQHSHAGKCECQP